MRYNDIMIIIEEEENKDSIKFCLKESFLRK